MAGTGERNLGQRHRAFARRIAARARPQAVAARPLVPGWIQRARDQASALTGGGIQPTVRPDMTLRLARPVVTRPVENAPPLTLARPVAPSDAFEAVSEVPQLAIRPEPEPTAAPFRVADVRRGLQAARDERAPTPQDVPTSSTPAAPAANARTLPAETASLADRAAPKTPPADRMPLPSQQPPARRAISRLVEEPEPEARTGGTPVEADATTVPEPIETAPATPAAAPTPSTTQDHRTEEGQRSASTDAETARQSSPLPTASDANEPGPLRPLPVGAADQPPPQEEALQAAVPSPAPEAAAPPPLVETSDAAEARTWREPDSATLVGAQHAEPSRPSEVQEARPVQPRPEGKADQAPAAAASPAAPSATPAEPAPVRRLPLSTPESPATPSTERPVPDADATTAVERASGEAGPAEPTATAPDATPELTMVARRVEREDHSPPPTPAATQTTTARTAEPAEVAPQPDAVSDLESSPRAAHPPRQSVPLEEALFGAAGTSPAAAPAPPAGEPAPPLRRAATDTPKTAPPASRVAAAPVRRTPSTQPAPVAQPSPALVRQEPEPEAASTAAPTAGATETRPAAAAQPDVQELAEQVWALIRDRIRVERERLGRP